MGLIQSGEKPLKAETFSRWQQKRQLKRFKQKKDLTHYCLLEEEIQAVSKRRKLSQLRSSKKKKKKVALPPTSSMKWILPMREMSMKSDSSLEPLDKRPTAQLTQNFSLSRFKAED